jgi:hypothetical protein
LPCLYILLTLLRASKENEYSRECYLLSLFPGPQIKKSKQYTEITRFQRMLDRKHSGRQTNSARYPSGETGADSQQLKKITFGGAIIHKIWYLAQS